MKRASEQLRLQSQSSRFGCLSYCCTHRAAEMSQRCWEEAGLPVLHSNLRQKRCWVRAEPGRRSRPLPGQDLMRETWDLGHLASATLSLSSTEFNSTQPKLTQFNPIHIISHLLHAMGNLKDWTGQKTVLRVLVTWERHQDPWLQVLGESLPGFGELGSSLACREEPCLRSLQESLIPSPRDSSGSQLKSPFHHQEVLCN